MPEDHGREGLTEMVGVEQPGRQAEAPAGVGRVGGVAREQDAPAAERPRGALVHAIGSKAGDLVGLCARQQPREPLRQAVCNGALGQRRVLAVGDPPEPVAVEDGDDRPVVGIEHEVRAREAVGLEVVVEVHGDEALRPRHPLEAETERFPHRAPCAVRPDQPTRAQLLPTGGRLNRDADSTVGLTYVNDAVAEADVPEPGALEMLERQSGKQVLPEVQVVRVIGVAGDHRHVHARQDGAVRAAELVVLLQDPALAGVVEQPEPIEERDGRGVVDDRARRLDDLRLRLEHGDLDTRAREDERRQQPDRAAAADDHAVELFRATTHDHPRSRVPHSHPQDARR
jgi:hypothetical protein